MLEFKLFEIPIYSMKEEEYAKRCYKYIKYRASKIPSKLPPKVYKIKQEELEYKFYYDRPWKYNQIIGYIVITYKNDSIWFDEYSTMDNKIHAVSEKRHMILNMHLNGQHFNIADKTSNEEIRKEIYKWFKRIARSNVHKPHFLDKEMFLLQLNNLDFINIINYYKIENRKYILMNNI